MKKILRFFYSIVIISLLFSCSKESTSTPENDFIRATVNGNNYSSTSVVAVKNPSSGDLGFFYSQGPDSISIGLSLYPTDPAYAEGTYNFRPASPAEVHFISFNIASNNFRPELTWVTINETNVLRMIVQRSVDGTNFSQVGIVNAVGNTTDNTTYSYIDATASFSNPVFYRIKLENADGSFIYSQVRSFNTIATRAFYKDLQGSYKGYNGTITITSHNRQTKVVSGIFSFDVKNYSDQLIQLRNGSFRISY